MNLIWDVRPQWFNLGLALGIDSATLEGISGERDETCFRIMVTNWLRMDPPASWKGLVEALCAPIVGRKDVARKVADKYNIHIAGE